MRIYIVMVLLITFGTDAASQTGPGGVGSNDGSSTLEYWFDANRGITGTTPVTTVSDLSGNNTTSTINGSPDYINSALNGRGVIRFDGVNDAFATSAVIDAITFPNITIFAVYVPQVVFSGSVWGEDNGVEWDRFLTDINLTNTLNASVGAGYDPGDVNHPCVTIPNLFNPGSPSLTNVVYREAIWNQTRVRVNGQLQSIFESDATPYWNGHSNLFIGAIGSNGFNFNGDIAEVIVYGTNINMAQQIIIENYLSAKYNIGLSAAANVYTQDDFGFDFDVAGIGRVDASSIQNNSQGTGIVRVFNPTNLNDNEFLMWGHNNGLLNATNFADVPMGVQARSNRVWRVSELNSSASAVDVGAVDVQFDLSGLGSVTTTDLRLIIDTDNNGIFSDETPIGNATHEGGSVYQFAGVTAIVNNRRFTFGTSNSSTTPLPVDLVYFKAEYPGNDLLELTWMTAKEVNTDYFEIQISDDAQHWRTLSIVKASGAADQLRNYLWRDHISLNQKNYFRLAIVDVDGKTNYSEVRSIFQKERNFNVYPNPANDILHIRASDEELRELMMMNSIGENVLDKISFSEEDEEIIMNISALKEGIYILRTQSHSTLIRKN